MKRNTSIVLRICTFQDCVETVLEIAVNIPLACFLLYGKATFLPMGAI